jgi:hypothetical protein
MEFEGRITAVLPARTGTRQDGTIWTDLSFVFAYYENGEQRFEDSALVSTFDTNIMAKIAPFIVRGADNKAVIENDVVKMNVAHIPCRCGFGHKVKIASKRDGTGTVRIQEMRCYKLEIAGAQQQPAPTQQPQGAFGQAVAPQSQVVYPFPPQAQEGGGDDLPF